MSHSSCYEFYEFHEFVLSFFNIKNAREYFIKERSSFKRINLGEKGNISRVDISNFKFVAWKFSSSFFFFKKKKEKWKTFTTSILLESDETKQRKHFPARKRRKLSYISIDREFKRIYLLLHCIFRGRDDALTLLIDRVAILGISKGP